MAGCAASTAIPVSRPCMWPSTISRAWPLPSCCPIRRRKPPSPSCALPWSSSPATASPSAPCSPTTAAATAPTASAAPAANSTSDTAALDPTRRKPTAKPNALSRPPCASGPTLNTGLTLARETPTYSPGPTTTTTTDPMVASTTSRPSAAPRSEQPLDLLQPPCTLYPVTSPISTILCLRASAVIQCQECFVKFHENSTVI